MAPGVLGIGTTAYVSAHNQVEKLEALTSYCVSILLVILSLDSRPCESIPRLSEKLQPSARGEVPLKKSAEKKENVIHCVLELGSPWTSTGLSLRIQMTQHMWRWLSCEVVAHRDEICQKFYRTRFSSQKFYTLMLFTMKRRKSINISNSSTFFVRIELRVLNFNNFSVKSYLLNVNLALLSKFCKKIHCFL